MARSKRIFFILSAIFLIIILLVCIDISRKTTWPGAKKNLKERIEKKLEE